MTIIVVRDGVMAVDSRVSNTANVVIGEIKKWRQVEEAVGGGYVAACGPCGECARALDDYAAKGGDLPEKVSGLHLCADGQVLVSFGGPWYEVSAPFQAIGSAEEVAMGALHAGASAERAVEIACDLSPTFCGGPIHVLSVNA